MSIILAKSVVQFLINRLRDDDMMAFVNAVKNLRIIDECIGVYYVSEGLRFFLLVVADKREFLLLADMPLEMLEQRLGVSNSLAKRCLAVDLLLCILEKITDGVLFWRRISRKCSWPSL